MTALYIIIGIIAVLVLIWLFAIMPSLTKNKTLNGIITTDFAHRGLHAIEKGIAENSLSAFSLAVENGFGIELDVRLTKDNRLVVFHDNDTTRICGVDGKINKMTIDEIKKLRLSNTSDTIPLLSEVLSLVDGKVPLLIEIKTENNTKAIMEQCFKLLDDYKGVFVVESFDPRPLAWLKRNRKDIARGQLACATGGPESKILSFLLTHLLLNFLSRPHFIAYEEEYIGKIPESVICIKLFGVAGFVWTVKEKEIFKKCKTKKLSVIFESFMP